ncbi:MAG: hypothetical protein U0793_27720 [Gemmataceae bacterium]
MKRSIRAFVRSRAGQRCEYCHLHESNLPFYLSISSTSLRENTMAAIIRKTLRGRAMNAISRNPAI